MYAYRIISDANDNNMQDMWEWAIVHLEKTIWKRN